MTSTQQIKNIDCFVGLKELQDNSVDLILTDPPYCIQGFDFSWNNTKLQSQRYKNTNVDFLPGKMKFDVEQSKQTQQTSFVLGAEYFRVLKPGGFLLSFSQARLYHRMTVAFEDCGFEIRDMLGWTYNTGKPKAFSQNHFVNNLSVPEEEKQKILLTLQNRKTPQLRPMIEPICLAQKPKQGTFVENWLKYGVGLIDVNHLWENKFPGNIIFCPKPDQQERKDNPHPTIKPLKLIEHLIKIFSKENDIILDPFLGSGTTAVAAINNNRNIIGFEIDDNYYSIIKKRIKQ